MMPVLDNKTILYLTALLCVVLSGAMLFLRASLKKYQGPGYWAAWVCGGALSCILLMLQDRLPPELSIVLAGLGSIASMCLGAHGLAVFLGLPRRMKLYFTLCAVVVLGQIWFWYFDQNFRARVVIVSLSFSVVWGDVALAMFRRRPRPIEPSYLFVMTSALMMALGFALRAALAPQGPAINLVSPNQGTAAGLLFFPLATTAITIGLVMLASARFARELEQGQSRLAQANQDLQQALDSVKTLSGLLPICASCKKIRDDQGYWRQIEAYLVEHTDASFTHGICPACRDRLYPGINKKPNQ